MINRSASLWLGITFVLVGAINVWLILQSSARINNAQASRRLVTAHRIGGYFFIALYCVMGYFMVARLGDVADGASPTSMVHMTLAMVLSPLLFVKVLIARYYKNHYSFLMPVGIVIFVLSFVLIGITAGPSLAHHARIQTVSLASIDLPPRAIDMTMAAATMEKRCSKCHTLDRVAGARKDARGWLRTVNRMKSLPDSGISEEESRIIVSYLGSQMAPKDPAANLEVGRALVDQRCGRCHTLERVFNTPRSPGDWRATVTKMAGFAEGSGNAFPPGEREQIIAYLSAAQTPDAVNQRKAGAAAPSAGANAPSEQASVTPDRSAQGRGYDKKMIGFVSFVFLSALVLIVRRPGKASSAAGKSSTPAVTVPSLEGARPGGATAAGPLILRLASITQQTRDAKTLRFTLADGRKLDARPGQFLTFSFLFDGKKVVRSYSICSSPARSGYVEITPKRVSQGCVSVFLNDRAAVGLTVEANGAFGHFYFDENRHHDLVLLAAGSGITPMMAMLRYIDDLCLETKVTVLYCVRTVSDIIFEAELDRLRSSLPNFQCQVLVSQPHAEWTGLRGHVSSELIAGVVKDLSSPDFFLCGPPAFMDASRKILTGLGVKPERIKQESFGSAAPKAAQPPVPAPETGITVEFARSGKTCTLRSGQTVLEAAEEHGIAIPSSCRQGQCGTCRTRLLEGTVRMDAEDGLDSDSRAQGFVLTCVGHAQGPVKLDA